MNVTLTWYEQQIAGLCGLMRAVDSLRRGRRRALFSGADLDENDIQAAGAEMAVAKLFNRYWRAGVDTPALPDVGMKFEVRRTASHRALLVRDSDHDDRRYVMVRGSLPSFEVVGWMLGSDAKRECWKRNPNGDGDCYLVPEDALVKIREEEIPSQPMDW